MSKTRRRHNANTLARARAEKVTDKPCRVCDFHRDIEGHHIVHRSKIGGKHPLVHHPDNIMPLCHGCHQAHHTTFEGRVPRRYLTEDEVTFVVFHASLAWLDRWYPMTPPEEL